MSKSEAVAKSVESVEYQLTEARGEMDNLGWTDGPPEGVRHVLRYMDHMLSAVSSLKNAVEMLNDE